MNIYLIDHFIYVLIAIEVCLSRRRHIFIFKDKKTGKPQTFICHNQHLQIGSTRSSATSRTDIRRTGCRQIVEQHQQIQHYIHNPAEYRMSV